VTTASDPALSQYLRYIDIIGDHGDAFFNRDERA